MARCTGPLQNVVQRRYAFEHEFLQPAVVDIPFRIDGPPKPAACGGFPGAVSADRLTPRDRGTNPRSTGVSGATESSFTNVPSLRNTWTRFRLRSHTYTRPSFETRTQCTA